MTFHCGLFLKDDSVFGTSMAPKLKTWNLDL